MEKIELRKITLNDAQDLFEYGSNKEVTKYLTWGPFKSIDEAIWTIENIFLKSDLLKYAIEYKPDKKMIGTIGISRITNNDIFIGYVLNQNFQNKGIMKQIFPTFINIVKNKYPNYNILAEVNNQNERSLKLLLKNDFIIIDNIFCTNYKNPNNPIATKLLKWNSNTF